MNKGECSKCGKTVIESTLENGVCLSCRLQEQSKASQSNSNQSRVLVNSASNSSATAITTLNGVAVIVLMLSMLSGLIIAVLGGQSGTGGGYLVVAGILIAVVGLVQWAFIKVFAGIAEDIKAIREKI